MKAVISILAVLMVSFNVHAKNSVQKMIEEKLESGCDLSVHGFSSNKSFDQYFVLLNKAMRSNDKSAVSNMVHYPLIVLQKGKKTLVKSSDDLIKRFDTIFSRKVVSAIDKQSKDKLFCNARGAMYGDGEVWIQQRKNKIGISTVNNF